MTDGTTRDSQDSTGIEHARARSELEELPPDAQWAAWWDELEDGITTSRNSVLVTSGSHSAQAHSIHIEGMRPSQPEHPSAPPLRNRRDE
jgi:hypothetical protein